MNRARGSSELLRQCFAAFVVLFTVDFTLREALIQDLEMQNGKIRVWRDYFDLAIYTKAIA